MEAGKNVKVEGKDNNLLELIAADPAFNMTLEDFRKQWIRPDIPEEQKYRLDAFIEMWYSRFWMQHKNLLGVNVEINV